MRVAIYARVSREGQDVDNQVDVCREYCEQKGYAVVGVYRDVVSGVKDSRPQLDALMKDCFQGKLDIVVVWKLDRLGRSLQHLLSIINQWKDRGVNFVCVTQPFDTTTSNGKLLFQIFGAIAEFERELISERTKLGLRRAKNVGKRGKDKKPRKKGGYYLRHMKQKERERYE
jgi:DNA invertase Pin-like site-specific DNA recombinase